MAGKTRKPFPLIKNGVFTNLMYDSSTAAIYKKEPTGHNLNGMGIALQPGNGPADFLEAVKDLGKVLYIPAFHYLNMPNANEGIFTGSSRFNALLIENGKVISPIFSSRVTDSFKSVFGNVKTISCEAESVNLSNTYGRRAPVAVSVPSYIVTEGIKVTDCAISF